LLSVAILFPLEMATGFLRRTAQLVVRAVFADWQPGAATDFKSPVKSAVKWLAGRIESGLADGLGLSGNLLGSVLLLLALAMIVVSLVVITKNMRLLMADRIEEWLNRVLQRSGLLGLGIGIVITMTVQSSSITTSLLVPMFGAGVLRLEAGFPIMLGANIGTTVTALLAATVVGPAGLTIAVVHLLFNLTGTAIFFPFRPLRRIPMFLAEKLADLAVHNRVWVVVYILGVFVVAPVVGILIWR
jgi:sodium-dependent phosphate cotransporter